MALGRKVLEPIKFVLYGDSAIQDNQDSYQEYVQGGYDLSKLKFKKDEKPTVFTLKQMTHRQIVARDEIIGELSKKIFTVQCGLLGVENFIIEEPDGTTSVLEMPKRHTQGQLDSLISQEWMEKAALPEAIIDVLSAVIDNISAAQPFLFSASAGRSGDTALKSAEASKPN